MLLFTQTDMHVFSLFRGGLASCKAHGLRETYVSIPFPPPKDYCLGFILQPLGTSISHD